MPKRNKPWKLPEILCASDKHTDAYTPFEVNFIFLHEIICGHWFVSVECDKERSFISPSFPSTNNTLRRISLRSLGELKTVNKNLKGDLKNGIRFA